jgi:hypothetical protein
VGSKGEQYKLQGRLETVAALKIHMQCLLVLQGFDFGLFYDAFNLAYYTASGDWMINE